MSSTATNVEPAPLREWALKLGLGRGINATDPFPWKNKTSFQVREVPIIETDPESEDQETKDVHVADDLLIETDEGGLLTAYQHDISNTTDYQTKIELSVDESIPTPSSVKIGVDSEYSRKISTTRKVVGKKVATRTVAFRDDFSGLPLYSLDAEPVHAAATERDGCERRASKFEEELCKWILDKISWRMKKRVEEVEGDEVATLVAYLAKQKLGSDELEGVSEDCKYFVELSGITHYVYALELGAAKFSVYSSLEFTKKFSAGGGVTAEGIADASVTHALTKIGNESKNWQKELGKFDPITKEVKRGTADEAVLSIQMKPIHTLVQTHFIRVALRNAVEEYIRMRSNTSEGPFLISTGDEETKIYMLVNDQNELVGTDKVDEASLFHIFYPDDGDHPYEFMLGYYGKEGKIHNPKGVCDVRSKTEELAPSAKYLGAKLSMFGRTGDPLELKYNVYQKHARFVLHSRLVDRMPRQSVDTNEWLNGERFFINCVRRWFKVNGYVALKWQDAMGYRSLCVPSVKHEDKPDTWMLFRLERRIKKAKAKPAAEGGEGGEGEGGEKEGAEGSGAGGSKLVGPTTDDRYEAWMQTGYNRIYGKEDEAQQS